LGVRAIRFRQFSVSSVILTFTVLGTVYQFHHVPDERAKSQQNGTLITTVQHARIC
jgi:hypothetical protein